MEYIFAILSMLMAITQQKQAADQMSDQADYANKNYMNKTLATMDQEKQINDQSTLESIERNRQALRAMANTEAYAADAGIMGNSLLRQIVDTQVQSGYDLGLIKYNRDNAIKQSNYSLNTDYLAAKQASDVSMNPWLSGLQIVSSGARGYAAGKSMED
jgi:hypothetical protein